MRTRKRYTSWSILAFGFTLGLLTASHLVAAAPLTEAEATQLGAEAYIYGYPLVTMEYSRRVITNVAKPEGTRAPMGSLGLLRKYPDASFVDVTAPNADTLYSFAFIDVAAEPYVLSLPEANDRYYLFPMLDAWTNVFQVPGKRTTGTGPQKYAITGPGWTGTLPDGVKEYKSQTSIVWILGRIYCTGTPEDYAAVHRLQDQVSLVPLSKYGKPYTPALSKVDPTIDMKTAVREQVNALSAEDYFKLVAKLLKDNPPSADDAPMVAKLKKLGVVAGKPFDIGQLGKAGAQALAKVPTTAQAQIMGQFKTGLATGDAKLENGWLFSTKTGLYGVDYLQRAFIAAIGLGANRPQDAVYPTSEKDAAGNAYSGANKYVMHFEKGQLPPAQGFWSLTMYNSKYFFVANPLNRFSISPRQDLKANADGTLDLYLQHESPGAEKESNWLPAPKDDFILMLRLYWPSEKDPSIINGSWQVPAVTRQ